MLVWIVLALNVVVWTVLALGFRRSKYLYPKETTPSVPISVIIALKNEAARIPHLVQSLKNQVYSSFEVVFVNDGSTDATVVKLYEAIGTDTRFRVLERPREMQAGKKAALSFGIGEAQYEQLAFTDADCCPDPQWLMQLSGYMTAEPHAVRVGFSPFVAEGRLLNLFVRYETCLTAYLTASFIGWGQAYMAVGRNLSYPKSLFKQVQGFSTHQHLLSGDDDLFIQTVQGQRHAPIRFLHARQTWVFSTPPPSVRVWFRQKTRHFSAARGYAAFPLLTLSVFQGLQLLAWLMLFFEHGVWALGLRWVYMALCFGFVTPRLHAPSLLLGLPLLDLFYNGMNAVVAPLGYLKKLGRW